MDKIFENFTVTVFKLYKLINKIKAHEMKEYDLKSVHVMCGYYLTEYPDGLTASELSKLTTEDKAAISRALAVMRERGLVEYDPDTYNANITLTYSGKVFAAAVLEKADRAVKAGSADMTDAERDAFYANLGSIAKNLKAYYDEISGE